MKRHRSTIAAAAAVLAATLAPSASAISIGSYTLHNHPDGAAAAPFYGLRLDDLLGDGIHTFDFDATDQGAAMFMDYDGVTVHIHGTAWGGLDSGDSYESPALWTIDMTYNTVVEVANGGVNDLNADDGVGTFTLTNGDLTFNLVSFAGTHPHAMFIGDEDGSGHRGFAGISGWGWLNYFQEGGDPSVHVYSSDFLFTAQPVPLPASMWFLASGLLGFLFVRRNGG